MLFMSDFSKEVETFGTRDLQVCPVAEAEQNPSAVARNLQLESPIAGDKQVNFIAD